MYCILYLWGTLKHNDTNKIVKISHEFGETVPTEQKYCDHGETVLISNGNYETHTV